MSKIEIRADMLISTLRSYLKAVGGKLELWRHFPTGHQCTLANLVGFRPSGSTKGVQLMGSIARGDEVDTLF